MILNRSATLDLEAVTGRTLEGIAYRYEHPSQVSDDGGRTRYWEEFGFGCDAKTIADRGNTFPLGWFHPWSSNAGLVPSEPLGAVKFRPSKVEGALLFEANVSKTRRGDESLELVRDRAAESVSVSYRPIEQRPRRAGARQIVTRTEIAIRELSLAPTGLGLHDDAKVLLVRAGELDDEQAREELSRVERNRRRLLLL